MPQRQSKMQFSSSRPQTSFTVSDYGPTKIITGSRQGFVNASNDRLMMPNGYITMFDNLPSLSQITAVADLVQSQGYKNAVGQLQTLQTNWANASNIVHTTDSLVKNTATRQQLWANIQANSNGNQSTLGPVRNNEAGPWPPWRRNTGPQRE